MALTPLAMVALRFTLSVGLHWARSMGMNSRTVVIAGAGSLGKRLADNVLETPWLGMKLRGFFDDQLAVKEIGIPVQVGVVVRQDRDPQLPGVDREEGQQVDQRAPVDPPLQLGPFGRRQIPVEMIVAFGFPLFDVRAE